MINPKIGKVIFYENKKKVQKEIPLRLGYFMKGGKEVYSIYFISEDIFDYNSSFTMFSLMCQYYPKLFYFNVDHKIDKKKGTDIEIVKIFFAAAKENILQGAINFIKKRNIKMPSKISIKIKLNKYIPLKKLMKKVRNEKVAEKI